MNRLIEWILHRLLPPDERDAILGDLAEERARAGSSDWWYLHESIALLLHAFRRNVLRNVFLNVLALALVWLVAFALVQATERLTEHWLFSSVAILISSALGVAIALRLRAFVAAVFLGGQVAFALAELAIHLVYGIRAGQGAPFHFAVMIAGTVGVVFGVLLMRGRASRQPLATTP